MQGGIHRVPETGAGNQIPHGQEVKDGQTECDEEEQNIISG